MSNAPFLVEEIVKFDPVKFTSRYHLDEAFLLNARAQEYRDQVTGILVMDLHTYIHAEVVHSETATVSVNTPATWWDHFKIECFPKWLLYQFPPKERVLSSSYTFEVKALYPEWRRKVDDMGKSVFRSFIRRTDDRS